MFPLSPPLASQPSSSSASPFRSARRRGGRHRLLLEIGTNRKSKINLAAELATPSAVVRHSSSGAHARARTRRDCRPPKISLPLVPIHINSRLIYLAAAMPYVLHYLHTTHAADSERSLLTRAPSRQRPRSCNWPSLKWSASGTCTTRHAIVAGGIRQRFEFSSEIESFNHAGFCSSSCRLPLDPLRTTITLRSLAFPGPISAMISTAATGKNGEAVHRTDADPDGEDGRKTRPMTIIMRRK